MNDDVAALEEFVANTAQFLQQTEQTLQQLAHEALLKQGQLTANQENGQEGSQGDPSVRLQQIGQQLTKLSQRSRLLQTYLQNGLDAPPADDEHWPRVKILQSHEEERTQLARELEDTVGQLLANAIFELASCQHLLNTDKAAVSEGLTALQQELEQGLASIKYFITNLEPGTVLGSFGLGEGVRRYLEQYQARTGLQTELRIGTNLGRLPNLIEIAIFRIIQEALQNVHHHANATHVEVAIEEKDGALEFSVTDNGAGMASERIDLTKKNLGIARMVDYAELLKGKLRIFSSSETGTRVVLSIPFQAL